ncbi:MAG: DNA-directed RNA polymerase subunit delta [Bacilli bacterium]|nr:DNA-directed RNA polymerase subunit delta [Bacilli bacterium]
MNKSMLDVAIEVITNEGHSMSFMDLFNAVKAELGLDDEAANKRLGEFYTELTLDSHFVALTDNWWDLRVRHTYDKVHIDVADVYTDVDDNSSKDEEDLKEEQEFEAQISGSSSLGEDEIEDEDGEEKSSKDDSFDLL